MKNPVFLKNLKKNSDSSLKKRVALSEKKSKLRGRLK